MLLTWLIACGTREPAISVPDGRPAAPLALDTPSGAVVWQAMDALDGATITLPPETAPLSDGAFRLDGEWAQTDARAGRLRMWSHALPFHNDMPRPNYAPLGARLTRGDKVIPYVNDPGDLHGLGWFAQGDTLELFAIENPALSPEPLVMRVPEVAALDRRRHWDATGTLTPAEFVRTDVTTQSITRPGLHVPAGGSVRFELDVPPGARLTWGETLLDDPLGRTAETQPVRALVTVDGNTAADDTVGPSGWQGKSADLAAYAGKHVTLELRTEGTGTDGAGHLVFTSPVLSVPPKHPVRRVVVVGVDTLRRDAIGTYGYSRPTTPELDAWSKQFVVFDDAWAPAPRTRPSFRSALTGRYPLSAISAPTLAQLLRPAGFRTAGVVANVHLVPRFGFNSGFEYWYYENGAKASDEIDRGLAWLREHPDEDSFLFLHLMDPHTFYNAPAPFGDEFQTRQRPKMVPELFDRWQIYQIMHRPGFGEPEREWIRAAYDGEVAYVSHELARLFSALDELPGETLTVLHSDHGEEFWDHGGYEHNHTLYDELVRAALWVRPPGGMAGGPHRIEAPVGLIDIVPTILDILGMPAAPTDGRSLRATFDPGRAADHDATIATLTDRPLMLGHLMFGRERWGVVSKKWKYILHTMSGEEEVYDVGSDPAETHDLRKTVDEAHLAELRAAMEQASGWPVRPGWRLTLSGRSAVFRLEFDAPIEEAGVIDPEAGREARANLEWGEAPEILPSQVAEVRVSDDHRSVVVFPGPRAQGNTLYVACTAACPAGRLVGEPEVPLADGEVRSRGVGFDAKLGTLILQKTSEEQVLEAADSAQLEALKSLGYLDGD